MPGERRRCRSCGESIVLLHTLAGKLIPVDADSADEGDIDYEPCRHVSHHATCPRAHPWSRPKMPA